MKNNFDDKQLKIFLHQMTKKEVGLKLLLTGSFAEIGMDDFLDLPSDIDMMCSLGSTLGMAVEDDEKDIVPKSFHGRLIKHSQNHPHCHPGFSRIESRDHTFIGKLFSENNILVKGTGPARKLGNIWKHDVDLFGRIQEMDIVYCIPCHGWPSTASAWITRNRISDWPSEDLIRATVAGGYHLVEKPHPAHPEDGNFWRISFSKSECLLMNSMNEVQKRVYALLRKMKKLIVQNSMRENIAHVSALSTYFFKTALLWFCEETPKEFWEYENVPIAVKEIIGKLVIWFIEKNCPNYFIPENNMLDHLADDVDLELDITSLVQFAENDWSDIEIQLMNIGIQYYLKPMGFHFSKIPAEGKASKATCDLKREVPSLLQCCDSKLSTLKISMDSKDIALERSSIAEVTYAIINLAMGRMKDIFGCTTEIQLLSSNKSHHCSIAIFGSIDRYVDRLAILKPASDDIQTLSVLYRFLRRWDLDTTGISFDSIASECRDSSISTHQNERDDIELLKIIGDLNSESDNSLLESQSRIEAINLSLANVKAGKILGIRRTTFVICTYLANYYYTVEKDFSSAMLLCNILIDACTSDICYIAFSELSFPVLLSSRWSKLFDDNIRAVYGFLVLFNCIITQNHQYSLKVFDAQPVVKFCSILFLRYIKVQLEVKCGDDPKVERAVQDFFWHLENRCPVDGHNWTVTEELSRKILLAVLRSSLAASNKLWMCENRNYSAPDVKKNELLPTSISLDADDILL